MHVRIEEKSEPMSTNSYDHRWILPSQQTDYPARDRLPEATAHGRREATFLVLAATFFVATAALFVLGTSRVVDVSALIARVVPGIKLPTAMVAPLGVVPFALSFVASALVCDLFGRRRATAMIWVGLIASIGLVGLMRVADLIDGGAAFGVSIAFTACYLVAHTIHLLGFDVLRRRGRDGHLFIRLSVASLAAQVVGWSAFALVLQFGGGYILAPMARETIAALSIGAAACSAACVIVLALPAAIVTRALALALRVGRDLVSDDDHTPDTDEVEPPWSRTQSTFAEGSVARPLPAAFDDDRYSHGESARSRAPRVAIQPYSSSEMRFFRDGDAAQLD